jgi:thiamine phosphate synthase YjbQ (UPF0047 family)
MQIITINSPKQKCVIDITKLVNDLLNKNFYDKGVIHINLLHTTCALACADMDPGTETDYINSLEKMVPNFFSYTRSVWYNVFGSMAKDRNF